MNKQEHEYKIQVLEALNTFQMLEMLLKAYISTAYNLIKKSLNESIPFNYSYKDIENHPLERLINTFTKLDNDKELHKKLNKLREGRNKLAHKALILSHDVFRELLSEDLHENHKATENLAKEADECLLIIQKKLESYFKKLESSL